MKVRYTGESDELMFIDGKIYDVISKSKGWYRIIDETEDDYLYPLDGFEIVEGSVDDLEEEELLTEEEAEALYE